MAHENKKSDLREFCLDYISQDAGSMATDCELNTTDIVPSTSAYSRTQRSRICASIIPYMLLDIASWQSKGPPNRNSSNIEKKPLPLMNHLVSYIPQCSMYIYIKSLSSPIHQWNSGQACLSQQRQYLMCNQLAQAQAVWMLTLRPPSDIFIIFIETTAQYIP